MNIEVHELNDASVNIDAVPPHVTIVCSDYFDTLVSRAIHPEDVKRQWAERVSHAFGLGLSDGELYGRRARIEVALCKRNAANGADPEFNVVECYQKVWEELAPETRPRLEAFLALSLELELSIECAVQRLDQGVVALLQQAAQAGRRIILVSDFYFPETAFRRMLRFHGIEQLFDRVFVSADSLLTKRSGRAFPMILEAIGAGASDAVMIGDNAEADHRQPQQHGMATILLDRAARHDMYASLARRAADRAATEREIDACLAGDKASAFPELALTLFTFTERLYASLLGAGVRDVFFLAREGQLLKQLFDHYQNQRTPTADMQIRSHYLEVSRRATFLPSLGPLETERFEILFRQYRRISAEEFLLNLSLEHMLPQLERELPGHDLHVREEDLPTSPVFQELLANEGFRTAYETARVNGRKAMLAYLDGFALQAPNAALTIVDVGWKGTIQDNLRRLFQAEEAEGGRPAKALNGVYLGLVSAGEAGPGNEKRGLMFSAIDGRTPHYAVFNENRALFEVMLAADHGSAAAYRLRPDGQGEVVLGEFSERSLFETKVRPEQLRLLATFERLDDLLAHRYYSERWLLAVTARHHARMVFNPAPAEIAWFTDVYHVENFGVFEHSVFGSPVVNGFWLAKMRFICALLRQRGRMDLGFWPWLRCRQRGGRLVAHFYRMYRLR
ncbi:hypothetical protein N5B55_02980 [Ralstonia pickettii]|uniref:HAD family hydrolase n=1 Tax=Ralstonia pickettii TaxID=329 RepID=UPI0027152DEF|nr:HAD family hydrolase [Ralstonia pickettii]WKZ85937.1 hypothetical protein N5B55_02980 [Ralstonia pickettii]